MDFFKKNHFFLKKEIDLEIVFNKSLSRKQKLLLNLLVSEINSLKIEKFSLKTKNILDTLNLKRIEELIPYLEKVSEFKVLIAAHDNNKNIVYSSYKIINSFFCDTEKITFYCDLSFLELYRNSKKDVYGIKNIIKFYNKKSYALYLLLEKQLMDHENFTISLEEFKQKIKIDNKYDRYFDIKTRVLNPALKEINDSLGNKYSFKEIRKSHSVKSTVTGIIFTKTKESISLEKRLLLKLDQYISKKNYLKYRHVFFDFIKKNDEDSIFKSIDFALSLSPEDFLKTFLFVLSEDLYLKSIQEEEKEVLFSLEEKFNNVNEITSLIINKLLELEYYDYYDQKLTQVIGAFKSTNILYYKNNDFNVFAKYSSDKSACIYIKKES